MEVLSYLFSKWWPELGGLLVLALILILKFANKERQEKNKED